MGKLWSAFLSILEKMTLLNSGYTVLFVINNYLLISVGFSGSIYSEAVSY